MKSLKFTVYFTTIFIVIYTLMARMSVPFGMIYLAFLLSQGLLIFMVWRILRDKYSTQKTFSDWYEDKDVRKAS